MEPSNSNIETTSGIGGGGGGGWGDDHDHSMDSSSSSSDDDSVGISMDDLEPIPKIKIWKPTSAIVYATAISDDNSIIYAEASNGYGYSWNIK